jgi:hypothetical protein
MPGWMPCTQVGHAQPACRPLHRLAAHPWRPQAAAVPPSNLVPTSLEDCPPGDALRGPLHRDLFRASTPV